MVAHLIPLLSGCSLVLDPSDLLARDASAPDAADGGDAGPDTPPSDTAPPDAPPTDTFVPPDASGPSGLAIDVSAGRLHTCAIRSDREVFCWGANDQGQAGQPDFTTDVATPTAVPLPAIAEQISLGERHSCARLGDGRVACWGRNHGATREHHRLGSDFGGDATHVPQLVDGVAGATDLEVGFWHACAVIEGGVRCWGQNQSGELGAGCSGGSCSIFSGATSPGLPAASYSDVAAGAGSSCALRAAGEVLCWGFNPDNQLGLTSSAATPAPPDDVDLRDFDRIEAGGGDTFTGSGINIRGHICAIDVEEETLRCWGANDDDQVIDDPSDVLTAPVPIPLSLVLDVALGYDHTCAVYGGGQVTCWGSNAHGQLGMMDSRPGPTDDPISFDPSSDANQVAAGERHSCARLDDGTLHCWGSNANGQLGVLGLPSSATPRAVRLPPEAK